MPISTALVGFGLAGRVFHGPFLADDGRYRLDTVVTSAPERVADAARLHPHARVVATLDEALARGPELVVVATPPASHVPVARAALEAGCAVGVDTPRCADPRAGWARVRRAEELGRPLTVFQNRRWDSEFLTLRRLLAQGALGEVWRFESRIERWKTHERRAWKAAATWREGGGVLFDLGSHLLDQALVLFGPAAEVHVELAAHRGGSDDEAFVSIRHENGVRSHLTVSTTTPQPGPRMRVHGSAGSFVKVTGDVQEAQLASGMSPSAPQYGREPAEAAGVLGVGDEARPVPSEPGRYQEFYRLLAEALRGGGRLPVDPRESLAVIELIAAAHARSAGP